MLSCLSSAMETEIKMVDCADCATLLEAYRKERTRAQFWFWSFCVTSVLLIAGTGLFVYTFANSLSASLTIQQATDPVLRERRGPYWYRKTHEEYMREKADVYIPQVPSSVKKAFREPNSDMGLLCWRYHDKKNPSGSDNSGPTPQLPSLPPAEASEEEEETMNESANTEPQSDPAVQSAAVPPGCQRIQTLICPRV